MTQHVDRCAHGGKDHASLICSLTASGLLENSGREGSWIPKNPPQAQGPTRSLRTQPRMEAQLRACAAMSCRDVAGSAGPVDPEGGSYTFSLLCRLHGVHSPGRGNVAVCGVSAGELEGVSSKAQSSRLLLGLLMWAPPACKMPT